MTTTDLPADGCSEFIGKNCGRRDVTRAAQPTGVSPKATISGSDRVPDRRQGAAVGRYSFRSPATLPPRESERDHQACGCHRCVCDRVDPECLRLDVDDRIRHAAIRRLVLGWLDEHETVLVAEEGSQVVGVAAFGWFRDVVKRPGYRFTVESTVHVRQDRWRSGIGRQLMGALVNEARASGKHMVIVAIDGANVGSIQFHERLGFDPVARMPEVGAKFGRWQDLVLMQLHLDDRTAPDNG